MRKNRPKRTKTASRKPAELTADGSLVFQDWKEAVIDAQSLSAIAPIAEQVGQYSGDDRPEVLRRLARDLKDDALPLMRELVKAQDRNLLLASLEATGQVASEESVEILSPIAESALDDEIRKAARRSLEHLRSLGIKAFIPMGVGLLSAVEAPTTFKEALAGGINGLGQRMLSFAQRIPGAGIAVIHAAIDDVRGVYDCGSLVTRRQPYDELSAQMQSDPRHRYVSIPWDYALHLLDRAIACNKDSGTPLPGEVEELREALGKITESFEQPLIYQHVDLQEVTDNKVLLAQSRALLDHLLFYTWIVSDMQIRTIQERLKEAGESWVVVPEAAQKDRLDKIMREGIDEIYEADHRARTKWRLEEMAFILHALDDKNEARTALAIAQDVGNMEIRPSSIEFLLAIVERTLNEGVGLGAQELQARLAEPSAPSLVISPSASESQEKPGETGEE